MKRGPKSELPRGIVTAGVEGWSVLADENFERLWDEEMIERVAGTLARARALSVRPPVLVEVRRSWVSRVLARFSL